MFETNCRFEKRELLDTSKHFGDIPWSDISKIDEKKTDIGTKTKVRIGLGVENVVVISAGVYQHTWIVFAYFFDEETDKLELHFPVQEVCRSFHQTRSKNAPFPEKIMVEALTDFFAKSKCINKK